MFQNVSISFKKFQKVSKSFKISRFFRKKSSISPEPTEGQSLPSLLPSHLPHFVSTQIASESALFYVSRHNRTVTVRCAGGSRVGGGHPPVGDGQGGRPVAAGDRELRCMHTFLGTFFGLGTSLGTFPDLGTCFGTFLGTFLTLSRKSQVDLVTPPWIKLEPSMDTLKNNFP